MNVIVSYLWVRRFEGAFSFFLYLFVINIYKYICLFVCMHWLIYYYMFMLTVHKTFICRRTNTTKQKTSWALLTADSYSNSYLYIYLMIAQTMTVIYFIIIINKLCIQSFLYLLSFLLACHLIVHCFSFLFIFLYIYIYINLYFIFTDQYQTTQPCWLIDWSFSIINRSNKK